MEVVRKVREFNVILSSHRHFVSWHKCGVTRPFLAGFLFVRPSGTNDWNGALGGLRVFPALT